MLATRNLRILAIAGSVLSLTAIALVLYSIFCSSLLPVSNDWDVARDNMLRCMPPGELRSDYAILTSRSDILCPKAYAKKDATLEEAAKAFPDSARIQLRVAAYSRSDRVVKALRRAAALDPRNALPLYILASKAAARQSWDEALGLLKEGNLRGYSTGYPINITDLPVRSPLEISSVLGLGLDVDATYFQELRELTRALSGHALQIQSHGQTDVALTILDQVKKMGHAVMRESPESTFAVMEGGTITRIALASEKDIYSKNGDRAGLAKVERESREASYLSAGVKAYIGQMMAHLLVRMGRFFAPLAAVSSIPLQILFVIISLIAWGVSASRSRNRQASRLHQQATERAFPMARLLAYYFLAFVPVGALVSFLYYKILSSDKFDLEVLSFAPLLVWISPVLLWISASRAYKRAYRKQAVETGIDAHWLRGRRAPLEEKREYRARIAGVHGGALVFITMWALGISMWMKISLGSFPWQLDYVLLGGLKEEQQYIADLLAHKISIPESAIHAEQQRAEEQHNRSRKDSGTPARPTHR